MTSINYKNKNDKNNNLFKTISNFQNNLNESKIKGNIKNITDLCDDLFTELIYNLPLKDVNLLNIHSKLYEFTSNDTNNTNSIQNQNILDQMEQNILEFRSFLLYIYFVINNNTNNNNKQLQKSRILHKQLLDYIDQLLYQLM